MVIRMQRAAKPPPLHNSMIALPPSPPPRHHDCHNIRVVCTHYGNVHHYTKPVSASEAILESLSRQRQEHRHENSSADSTSSHENSTADVSLATTAHPANNYLLCESASLRVGKRPCPLQPDKLLESGHLYFLLPVRVFQHRLAWSYISSLAAMAMEPPPVSGSKGIGAMNHSKTLSITKRAGGSGIKLPQFLDAKSYLYLLLRGKAIVKLLALRGRRSGVVGDAASSRDYCPSLPVQDQLLTSTLRARMIINNICHNPETNSKYVQQLIDRSNSWRPHLLTIQESMYT